MDLELLVGLLGLLISTIGFLTGAYTAVVIGLLFGAVGFGMLLSRPRE